jgi:SRSO17 transposase
MEKKTSLASQLSKEVAQIKSWSDGITIVAERIGVRFSRSEAREQAVKYIEALLSTIERKNGWQIAEEAGEKTPYGMQHLLGRAQWSADELRDDLQQYVQDYLAQDDGVMIVDETGFLKKGSKSAGVQRQYSGTAGRIENCQIGVFLAYASSKGRTFIDRELYLPKEWAKDADRRLEADIPKEVKFATKGELARRMLERAFDAGIKAKWVTADEVYGSDRKLRMWLEEREQPFVLAITSQEYLWIGFRQVRVSKALDLIPTSAWHQRSAGDGTKGPRLYEWAAISLTRLAEPQWEHWLLVRRNITDPTDLAYYVVFAPTGTTLQQLAEVAGTRWAIEESFETAKGEVGLDQYEVRSWTGWYRHITLSLWAHAFLTVTRALAIEQDVKKSAVSNNHSSLALFKKQRGL